MFEITPDRYPLLIAVVVAGLLMWYLAYRLTKPLVRRVITRGSRTPARAFWLRLFDPRSDSEILSAFQKLGLRTGDATPTFICLYWGENRSVTGGPIGLRFRPPLATSGSWQRDDILAEIRAATGLRNLRVYGKSVPRRGLTDRCPRVFTRGIVNSLRERYRRRTPDELVLIWS